MAVEGYQLIAFEWAMVGVTGVFVGLRYYIRIINRMDRERSYLGFQWMDFWVLMAWVNFICQCGFDTILSHLGSFNEKFEPSDAATIVINKIYYVEDATYLNTMYCVKCAMLCFFSAIIPHDMKKTRIAWWITVAFVGLTWLSGILMSFLWCWPVWRNWTLDEKLACYNLDAVPVVACTIGAHLASDIMIYCLPFPDLRTVKLPFRQKVGVAVTFASGFFCIFFASALLAASYVTWMSTATVYCFSTMEQTWAILVACLPAFRMVYRGTVSRKGISTMGSSTRWTSAGTGARKGISNLTGTRDNTRSFRGRQGSLAETSLFPQGLEKEIGDTVALGMGTSTRVESRTDMVDIEMAAALGIGIASGGPSVDGHHSDSDFEGGSGSDSERGWNRIDGTKLTIVDVTTEHIPQQPSPLLPPCPVYERRF